MTEQELSLDQLLQIRRDKLARFKSSQVNPYPATSPLTENRLSTTQIKEKFSSIQAHAESEEKVRLCGRLMTRRDMGKAAFAHIQDFGGRLQIYLKQDVLGESAYGTFTKDIDLGDILGVEGKIFRTRTGELTVRVEKFAMLSKSLRPMPEKWHGLKDVEMRSRQRELDLISNEESRQVFEMRTRIVQSLRSLLYKEGYIEVETPMMQPIPGGAVARPFETFHNALGQKFYLRVAPELYLKRCLVGGFEKVFEIGRVFRNEGIDSLHNPEFTILEAYQAFGNMESMMTLTETLVFGAAKEVNSPYLEKISVPFERQTMLELFRKYVGEEEAKFVETQNWSALAKKHGTEGLLEHKVFDHLFDEKIASHLQRPTFVTEFPAEFSPLAKCKEGAPHIAERFELYIEGEEIANAYSELNDPIEQRTRLENYHQSHSSTKKEGQDKEAEGMGLDEAFIAALEYGMPPAGGLGIGVDRLVMLLTGKKSVRDVLLFPTLKSEK